MKELRYSMKKQHDHQFRPSAVMIVTTFMTPGLLLPWLNIQSRAPGKITAEYPFFLDRIRSFP
jgi:hypothetical protein